MATTEIITEAAWAECHHQDGDQYCADFLLAVMAGRDMHLKVNIINEGWVWVPAAPMPR